ncbi:hypothetical protein AB3G45_24395 [Shinella sp. S4-D37]|jgi:hypothetical protein|uniref:hypothetical protein n=1 Tax=Shinella sp. S4-D37 TaxID=3161999 RepID=UPI0034665B86
MALTEAPLTKLELSAVERAMLEEMIGEASPKKKRGRPVRHDRTGETPEQRTARKTEHQRQRRAGLKAREAEKGSVIRTADTTTRALADAAMILLAEGGETADRIEAMLAEVFAAQIGAPMSIRTACRSRSLKPKYLSYPPLSPEERQRRALMKLAFQ